MHLLKTDLLKTSAIAAPIPSLLPLLRHPDLAVFWTTTVLCACAALVLPLAG